MSGEQLQRIADASCAGISESRGFHRRHLPPAGFRSTFQGLEGGHHQRSSLFIERLFRDLRLLDLSREYERRTVCSALERTLRERSDESGFLHDADPSPREGLAAVVERRPRSLSAGRRIGAYGGL